MSRAFKIPVPLPSISLNKLIKLKSFDFAIFFRSFYNRYSLVTIALNIFFNGYP